MSLQYVFKVDVIIMSLYMENAGNVMDGAFKRYFLKRALLIMHNIYNNII